MKKVLEQRFINIGRYFDDDFLESFLEDNDILQGIIFFGSFMKGTQHEQSDLDVILIPTPTFLEETEEDGMERIETLLRLHDDLSDGLTLPIALDVKFQEFQNENEQYGWTFRTGNALATFYSFIKGEIGDIAFINQENQLSFSRI